jgi:hypothetical protein
METITMSIIIGSGYGSGYGDGSGSGSGYGDGSGSGSGSGSGYGDGDGSGDGSGYGDGSGSGSGSGSGYGDGSGSGYGYGDGYGSGSGSVTVTLTCPQVAAIFIKSFGGDMSQQLYVIQCIPPSGSGDHCVWWRPDSAGYTTSLDEAGRYTEQEAKSITCLRSVGATEPRDIAITEDDAARISHRVVSSFALSNVSVKIVRGKTEVTP